MVGVAELESATNTKKQPQKSKSLSECPPICPPNKRPNDLLELLKLWPDLSDEDKNIIILIARKGGRK